LYTEHVDRRLDRRGAAPIFLLFIYVLMMHLGGIMLRVGLSGALIADQDKHWEGSNRHYVNDAYIKSVCGAGAAPLIIPVTDNREVIDSILDICGGIILTGGVDISPLAYGEEPIRGLGKQSPQRDAFEVLLFRRALERSYPIFGICRGMQLINVALGGTLYQNIEDVPDFTIQHNQKACRHVVTHHVDIEVDSYLFDALGKKCLVNSWHHQAIKDVALGLRVTARSRDGLIEAVESNSRDMPPIVGVQWHPEELASCFPDMAKLFKNFVAMCRD
jgi:putative glutamine amidotransferase